MLFSDISTLQSDCTDGDVRLVNGNTEYEGRVEVCINKAWGTVCSIEHNSWWWRWGWHDWDLSESNIVCKQIGHMELGNLFSDIMTEK